MLITWRDVKKDWSKLPNLITLSRLLLCWVPAAVLSVNWDYESRILMQWTMLYFVAVLAATDYLDGYIAKKRNLITRLGTFLDPIVDKIFSSAILLAICVSTSNPIVWAFAIFTTIREIDIAVIQFITIRKGKDANVLYSGKVKTLALSVTIALLLLPPGVWDRAKYVFMALTFLSELYSWIDYVKVYTKRIQNVSEYFSNLSLVRYFRGNILNGE